MGDGGDAVHAALAPEEWRELEHRPSARALDAWSAGKPERRREDDPTQYVAQIGITYDGGVTLMSRAHERVEVPPPARAALAALALHGQPFGFTHDDVRALRSLGARHAQGGPVGGEAPPADTARRLGDLADRLEALLPPAG